MVIKIKFPIFALVMKQKKIYLYAGYYEMFITDVPMPLPYTLISWHKSVEAAERNAERLHPGDNYYFKVTLFPDDLKWVLEDVIDELGSVPTSVINGEEFYIV